MIIKHENPTTYRPLMVHNVPANQLENVTNEHDVPALASHLAVDIGVDELLTQINKAIGGEGASLTIQEAIDIVPEGLAIESATILIKDALELTVLIPGEVYPQLFARNLIGFFK